MEYLGKWKQYTNTRQWNRVKRIGLKKKKKNRAFDLRQMELSG